jgi:protein-S-isoprenylcysteine O-methyltransferase Ste14
MSLVPVFEIGLWNAWIFMLYIVFYTVFFLRLAKEKDATSPSEVELSKTKMSLCIFSKLIIVPAVIYSVFLPLKLGTTWFCTGLPIALIGILTGTIVLMNWANTPPGEPVTRGLYIYSRHPMYITTFLFFLGVSIASASLVFLLVTIIFIVGAVVFIGLEEEQCLEKYGDTYREYMDRTPRWIGIAKSKKN